LTYHVAAAATEVEVDLDTGRVAVQGYGVATGRLDAAVRLVRCIGMTVCMLDHIVLNVEDVERSLRFYQDVLGLAAERVDVWRLKQIGFPSVRINASTLIDLVSAPKGDTDGLPNLAHFCLVTDSPSLTEAMHSLAGAGVEVETGPVMRWGARGNALSIYFRDPDRNLIELRTYQAQT
jgi:catechol 2,3-dioxygenase-like lactoylglutathione lyase family enzyme